jgi:outer membrane protein assembly factor BamD
LNQDVVEDRMRSALRALVLGTLLVAPLAGCEATPAARSSLNYTADAKRAYDEAMEEFNAKNWIEAQSAMREVKKKYSYSRYARLAELRIADADFEQEKFAEAIRGYKQFVHDHRSDTDEVAYARSRVAEAQYKEISESFLLPAVEERDQASAVEAYRELKSFIQDYPDAKDTRRMCELLEDVTTKLVKHEIYVARFYLARDNFEGAVARLQYALRNYVGTSCSLATMRAPQAKSDLRVESEIAEEPLALQFGQAPDALLLLGETYLKMHRFREARVAFQALVENYAASALVIPAREYLEIMKTRGV